MQRMFWCVRGALWAVTLTCMSWVAVGQNDVGPEVLAIALALDTNANNRLDDEEMETATTLWITGQPVPGHGGLISDAIIQALIRLWVTGTSLGAGLDFGDAPRPYSSLLADDGARHRPGGLWLGTSRDVEPDAKVTDLDALDDADLAFYTALLAGASVVFLEVDVSAAAGYGAEVAYLTLLIDQQGRDCQGDGWGVGDTVLLNAPVEIEPGGTKRVTLPTPLVTAPADNQWLRLTLTPLPIPASGSWDGRASSPFADGETEDYCKAAAVKQPPPQPPHLEWPVWLKNTQSFYPFPSDLKPLIPDDATFEEDDQAPLPGKGVQLDAARSGLVVPDGQLFGGRALVCVKRGNVVLFKLWILFMPHDPVPPPPEDGHPDLVLDNVVLNDGRDGGPVAFAVRVWNQGAVAALGPVVVEETLGNVKPNSCRVLRGTPINPAARATPDAPLLRLSWAVPDLAPRTVSTAVVVCDGGTLTLAGLVDPDNGVRESDENNNADRDPNENVPFLNNLPPRAVLSCTTHPLKARCDGGGSNDPDGVVVLYRWDFGDRNPAYGPQVDHDYAQPGEYQVQLTVVDDHGAETTAQRSVRIQRQPPGGLRILGITHPGQIVGDGTKHTATIAFEAPNGNADRLKLIKGKGAEAIKDWPGEIDPNLRGRTEGTFEVAIWCTNPGVAILSDIEVFFLLESAQGDQQSNQVSVTFDCTPAKSGKS